MLADFLIFFSLWVGFGMSMYNKLNAVLLILWAFTVLSSEN
jgi:hypothetical protein